MPWKALLKNCPVNQSWSYMSSITTEGGYYRVLVMYQSSGTVCTREPLSPLLTVSISDLFVCSLATQPQWVMDSTFKARAIILFGSVSLGILSFMTKRLQESIDKAKRKVTSTSIT